VILHLVTDRHRLARGASEDVAAQCLLRQTAFAVEAGIDVIQLRERDLDARALAALASAILDVTKGTSTRLVINDRLDVALACGAHGVHLPAAGLPVDDVRRIVPRGFLVGRSVHTVSEVEAAAGADYALAGTVWPSASKPVETRWLERGGLSQLVAASRVPVLAIGGVTWSRVHDVAIAGAAGVAGIGLFLREQPPSPCAATPLNALARSARLQFDTSMGDS
jgi:thiamine-phosphate pyrophosphorylase